MRLVNDWALGPAEEVEDMRIQVNQTELFVDVDGSALAVHDQLLVDRPTIVALHGGPGFDQGYLRPGLGPLRDLAQAVFVDLRGHGRSGRPPIATCTLEQMADDVAALCGHLGIDRPILFGHSAGGFVALHMALRHPELPGGLILCDTAPTLARLPDDAPPPSLASRASPRAVEIAARMFGGDFSAEVIDAFARSVAPFYAGPTHQDVPGSLMALSGFSTEVAQFFFGTLAPAYDLRPRLADITTPTLVVVGHYDWVCPPVASRLMAGAIPEAQLVEVADAGHFVFSEEPTQFHDTVAAFLSRVGSVTPHVTQPA